MSSSVRSPRPPMVPNTTTRARMGRIRPSASTRGLASKSVLITLALVATARAQELPSSSAATLRSVRTVRLCPEVESRPVRDLVAFAVADSGAVALARMSADCSTLALLSADARGALGKEIPVSLPRALRNRATRFFFGDSTTLFALRFDPWDETGSGCTAGVIDRRTGDVRKLATLPMDGVTGATVDGDGALVVAGWRRSASESGAVLECFDRSLTPKWSTKLAATRKNESLSGPSTWGPGRVVVLEGASPMAHWYTLDGQQSGSREVPSGYTRSSAINSRSDALALLDGAPFFPRVVTLDAAGAPLHQYALSAGPRSRIAVTADQLFLGPDGVLWRCDGCDLIATTPDGTIVRSIGYDPGVLGPRAIGSVALARDGSLIAQCVKTGSVHRIGQDGRTLRSVPYEEEPDALINPRARIEIAETGDTYIRNATAGGSVCVLTSALQFKRHEASPGVFTINSTNGSRLSWSYGTSPRITRASGETTTLPGTAFYEGFGAVDARLLDNGVVLAFGLLHAVEGAEEKVAMRAIRPSGEIAYAVVFPDAHAPVSLACGVRWAVAYNGVGSIWLIDSHNGSVARYAVPDVDGASNSRQYFIKTANGKDAALVEVDPKSRLLREFSLPR